MSRDSLRNTLVVAGSVCAVCALVVSAAAVGLKPLQEHWIRVDTQRNILLAAAADNEERERFKRMTGNEVSEFFDQNFQNIIIDLATGEDVTDQYTAEERVAFRQIEAAELRKPGMFEDIPGDQDRAQIKRRELRSHVYIRQDETVRYVFPIRGKGLWSTLKGFIALYPDLQTVAYITFYAHAETPGLGGEVDNLNWKGHWDGKELFDQQGRVVLTVVKGEGSNDREADGLSGATITAKGVENMLKYWMGDNAFGPYLQRLRSQSSASP